jgi:hypothetical protein
MTEERQARLSNASSHVLLQSNSAAVLPVDDKYSNLERVQMGSLPPGAVEP